MQGQLENRVRQVPLEMTGSKGRAEKSGREGYWVQQVTWAPWVLPDRLEIRAPWDPKDLVECLVQQGYRAYRGQKEK